ncbi:MAG: DNA recombination protein RmuC [Gammaproteobacteria bacterium]|nr:DNA recombination protein RmuC [Gammaproteobacteria bacterium]
MQSILEQWLAGVRGIGQGLQTDYGNGLVVGLFAGIAIGVLFYWLRQTSLKSLYHNQARLDIANLKTGFERDRYHLEQTVSDLRRRLADSEHDARTQSVVNVELGQQNARLEESLKQIPQLQSELEKTRGKLSHAEQSQLDLTQRASEAQARIDSMAEAQSKLTAEFQLLADKIFKEQQRQFGDSHRAEIGRLLDPLKNQLQQFKTVVDSNRENELRERTLLKRELEQLKSLNQQLSDDAQSLAQALRGSNKLQGNWGELVLERVLESSGLVLGREYEREVALKSPDGETFRPDVLIHLPDQRFVIVDAKVSLRAYENAIHAESDAAREAQLSLHIQSLRQHVSSLSAKNYEQLDAVKSLDFVLLFIPIEGAFHAAMQHSPELYADAFKRNVVLVSPTTLLVTLRTIHNIWRYQSQNDNAQEIAVRAGRLIDQFSGFVEELDHVERHIDRAKEATDKARRKLSTGRGNLVAQAKTIQTLGAPTKKPLPDHEEEMLDNLVDLSHLRTGD